MAMDDLINSIASDHAIIAEAPAMVAGRTIHIDADMLCYVAGGKEGTTVNTSRTIVYNMTEKFRVASASEFVLQHLTASGSLKGDRVLLPIGYQAQRKNSRRPENWQYLRDWFPTVNSTAFKTMQWFDREADDGFGWVWTSRPNDVICTRDKDMQMIPGNHLVWDTCELIYVDPDAYEFLHGDKVYGYKWFLLQLLMGDAADGIRGLGPGVWAPRGVGPATANKFLKGTTCKEEGIQEVIQLYEAAFGDEWADELAQQCMLLWIRRGKTALLDEFIAFMPMLPRQRASMDEAIYKLKAHVKTLKEEAAQWNK